MVFIRCASAEFQNILTRCPKERKWFLWHLIDKLENYKFFQVKNETETIGAICISPDSYVDIIILEKYRRKRLGLEIITQVKDRYPIAKFMVNVLNKKSILFFEFLSAEKILSRKIDNDKFRIYQ